MGSWAWWRSWIQLFVGCAIMGSGFVFFINPYNFVPGGVYGAGIVLHNIFPSIQVGTFGYMFDVPLMITAVLVFGGQFGARTVVAALFTPGFMNILTRLVYSDAAFTADGINLDPALLLGGSLNLSNDLLLTCIIGAVVIGVGQGYGRADTGYHGRYGHYRHVASEVCGHQVFHGYLPGGLRGEPFRLGGDRFRSRYGR